MSAHSLRRKACGLERKAPPVSEAAASPVDPGATIRSRSHRVLLVFAALIGVLAAVAIVRLPGRGGHIPIATADSSDSQA